MNRICLLAICLLLANHAATSRLQGQESAATVIGSTVVFNSFGTGDSYNTHTGWGISGASASGGYRGQAQPFIPNSGGNLSTIELALGKISGSGLSSILLLQDLNGIPGSPLETFPKVAASGNFGANNPLVVLTSATQPLLNAGTTYWVAAEPNDATAANSWNYNSVGLSGAFAFERSEGGWSTLSSGPGAGAFRVSVIPVPEPQAWALLVAGASMLALRRLLSPRIKALRKLL